MQNVTTLNRVQAGVPAGGQFAATQHAEADVELSADEPNDGRVFYVTAHDAGRRALLAGPFPSQDAADAVTQPARDLLSKTSFRDALGSFVEVGVTGATPRPGRPVPQGRFNAELMPRVAMSHRDVIAASKTLDKQTHRDMDRILFRGNASQRDAAVKAAWNVTKGTPAEAHWRESTYQEMPVRLAAIGAATRDRIGQGRYTREHYDLLTEPWRKVVGPIHPDDTDLRPAEPEYDRHEELTEAHAEARAEHVYAEHVYAEQFDEYGRREIDNDDPRNMDLYDGD